MPAFDYDKFETLKRLIKDAQFVPMDPSMAGGDPAAAGAMPPDAGAMPPDAGAMPPDAGAMPPGDPAAGGMPPPGDPMAGGMPPDAGMPPMDPAAMGMPPMDGGDVSPTGEPYMKITPTQLSKLFKQFAEVFKSVLGIQSPAGAAPSAVAAAPAQDPALAQKMTELDAKIDALLRG